MDTMLQFILAKTRAAFGYAAEAEVSVLDIGTGNGVLPLELAATGFSKVTGVASALLSIKLKMCEHVPCCLGMMSTDCLAGKG